MKQLSLWFAFFSCTVLASLLPESCTKKDGVLDPQSLSKTATLSVATSTTIPPADPAIAYLNNNNINLMVMNADGSNQTVIATADNNTVFSFPSWSPDAKSIVFCGTIGGQTGMWIVGVSVVNGKPTGSIPQRVLINLTGRPTWTKWSPVADTIVFMNMGVNDPNIYLIPSTGGTPTIVYTPASASCEYPTWSPDATKLVFLEVSNGVNAPRNLNVFDRVTKVTTTIVPFGNNYGERSASWSRHGDRIAYAYGTSSIPEAIYMVAPTSNATPLYLFAGVFPTWSPDDSKLAYYAPAFHSDKAGIYSYTFSTGTRTRLADGTQPDWRKFY